MGRLKLRNRVLSIVLFLIGMAPLTFISIKLIGAHSRSSEFLLKNITVLFIVVLLGGALWSVCWGREAILGCGIFAFLLITFQDSGMPFMFALGFAGVGAILFLYALSVIKTFAESFLTVLILKRVKGVRRSPRVLVRQFSIELLGLSKQKNIDTNTVQDVNGSVFERLTGDEWPNLHEVSGESPTDHSPPSTKSE